MYYIAKRLDCQLFSGIIWVVYRASLSRSAYPIAFQVRKALSPIWVSMKSTTYSHEKPRCSVVSQTELIMC